MKSSFYRSSLVLFLCTNLAAVLSYLFQAMMSRHLNTADFGLMNALFSLLGFLSIPLNVCSTTWTRQWSELVLSGRSREVQHLWWSLITGATAACLVLACLTLNLSPMIAWWLKTENIVAIQTTILCGTWTIVFGLCVPLVTAHQWFGLLSAGSLGGALLRIGIAALGIYFGTQLSGAILATSLSSGVLFLFILFRVRWPRWRDLAFHQLALPLKEWMGPMMASIANFCILGADVLVVRRFHDPHEAGVFAQVMVLGKTLFYVIAPLSMVVLPKTARSFGVHPSQETRVVRRALLMGAIILMVGAGGVSFFAPLALQWLTGSVPVETLFHLHTAIWCLIPLSLCQLVIPAFLGRRQERLLFQFMLLCMMLPLGLMVFHTRLQHAFLVEGGTGLLLLLFLLLNQKTLLAPPKK